MKSRLFKKLNNAGNTLVIVLVVVAFMTVLGTIAVTSAMVGYKMKLVDKEVKRTFYSAEEVVDEIYAGLGMKTMQTLQGAYMNILSNVTVSETFNGDVYKKQVTNNEANALLREKFTADLIMEFTGSAWTSKDTMNTIPGSAKFLELINTEIIENPTLAKAVSVGNIGVVKSTSNGRDLYTLSFKNLTVEYRTNNELDSEDMNTYFSRVTFDGVIDMDKYVNFATDTINALREFEKFSVIGCLGVDVNTGATVETLGGIYAGVGSLAPSNNETLGGLVINSNASLDVKGDNNPSIISKGRISLNSSIFKAVNANVWCVDLITAGDDAKVDISGDTYVKDDTEINGNRNEVKLAGNYYGYSTGNIAVSGGNHLDSSAIIVNGTNTKVDLLGINTLLLAGRAFIDYSKSSSTEAGYVTGQALALKGNQEVYLVPESLMTEPGIEAVLIGDEYHNIPVTKTAYNSVAANKPVRWLKGDGTAVYVYAPAGVNTSALDPTSIDDKVVTITLNEKNFFGYNYLNPVNPFRFVNISGRNYIYFNFLNEEAVKAYYDAIFAEDGEKPASWTATEWTQYKTSKENMRKLLRNNIDDLNQTSILNMGDSNMKLLINGSLINATPKTVNDEAAQIGNVTAAAPNVLSQESIDMQTRYKLAYRTLLVQPLVKNGTRDYWGEIPEKVVVDEYLADLSGARDDVNNITPFDYYINSDGIDRYLDSHNSIIPDNNKYIAVIKNEGDVTPFEIPSTATRGVVIATGDVAVSGNFNGIIFAKGKVIVKDSATVSFDNAATTVILDGNKDLRECFNAYTPASATGGSSSVQEGTMFNLKYEELITFENWRKQAPTTTSSVLPGGAPDATQESTQND